MSTYRAKNDSEEILNYLVRDIVIAIGGTVNSNDLISLLQSWKNKLRES